MTNTIDCKNVSPLYEKKKRMKNEKNILLHLYIYDTPYKYLYFKVTILLHNKI